MERILTAIEKFAHRFPEVQIVFPVHPNPNIRQIVYDRLDPIPNILLTPPLSYPYLVWILNKSYFVVTDSGGIQEEAPYLGKPVLVLRTLTERVESIQAGTAVLVGNQEITILENMVRMYEDEAFYRSFQQKALPYGTGDSADQILRILKERL
jgi:UDP-N-acetylglucosamine 2-epimerase (non-hydrolysing)